MNGKYRYELIPDNGQKSFYGKALVIVENDISTLYSYNTPIISRSADGTLTRLWSGFTATTGKHIKAFCGLNKNQFLSMDIQGAS